MLRIGIGDRVQLTGMPTAGVWAVHARSPHHGWVYLSPKDSFAHVFASLSPCGMVEASLRDLTRHAYQGDTLL